MPSKHCNNSMLLTVIKVMVSGFKQADAPHHQVYLTPCRTYKWIVKGGEDVRTDERMEMILDVCNGLLARHPGAASHRLKVRHASQSVDRSIFLIIWTPILSHVAPPSWKPMPPV